MNTLACVHPQLQYSSTAVGVQDLTDAFGWDASRREDVHEFSWALCDKLEQAMKVRGYLQ